MLLLCLNSSAFLEMMSDIGEETSDLPGGRGQLLGRNRDRVWSVMQEPPIACDGEDARCQRGGVIVPPPDRSLKKDFVMLRAP